jgi:hypothetical protein
MSECGRSRCPTEWCAIYLNTHNQSHFTHLGALTWPSLHGEANKGAGTYMVAATLRLSFGHRQLAAELVLAWDSCE